MVADAFDVKVQTTAAWRPSGALCVIRGPCVTDVNDLVLDELCPRCKGPMAHQTWESNDGAYEDSKYSCADPACGHVRWVDGIDS